VTDTNERWRTRLATADRNSRALHVDRWNAESDARVDEIWGIIKWFAFICGKYISFFATTSYYRLRMKEDGAVFGIEWANYASVTDRIYSGEALSKQAHVMIQISAVSFN